ncbi:hypothetical protein BDV25DRAFT_172092 [Aspergillus avenaceus]|uniref:DUF7703 domain-containing protein n=1 Tax=Aspergillus avenaceus TaxID=36643 RepID=A0A5N6U763_ASPAV|nr:hypothetical protein BDV25DRAFT_172092 [Aspergillus avenaceus]
MPFDPSPTDQLLESTEDGLSQVQKYIICAFAGIVWFNAGELVICCLTTFKRYRGLYFWSLFITSVSLIPMCLGYVFLLFYLGITRFFTVTLIIISWIAMVTGHSVVLWSRLHLVVQSTKVLRGTLIMIIVDAILFHTSVAVLMYGSIPEKDSTRANRFARGYNIVERAQLVAFCVQELILSFTYVWETVKLLRLRPGKHQHHILWQLLIINLVIIILDVAVVAVEFTGYYGMQVMVKPVAYSIKLKLEYAILGKLIKLAKGPSSDPEALSSSLETYTGPSGVSASGSNGVDLSTQEIQNPFSSAPMSQSRLHPEPS